MADDVKVKVHNHAGGLGGAVWFGGWLFTIGYLHLHLAQSLFALIIWPYYLGSAFGP